MKLCKEVDGLEHIGAIIQRVLEDLWRQREEAERQPVQDEKTVSKPLPKYKGKAH